MSNSKKKPHLAADHPAVVALDVQAQALVDKALALMAQAGKTHVVTILVTDIEHQIEKPTTLPLVFTTPFPRIWPAVGLRVDLLNHHPARVHVTLRAIGVPLQNVLPSAAPRGARGGFEFL